MVRVAKFIGFYEFIGPEVICNSYYYVSPSLNQVSIDISIMFALKLLTHLSWEGGKLGIFSV